MGDTKYRDRDGNLHDNRSDAEAVNAKGPGVSEAGANIMIAIFGPILLLGFIGILLMTFIKQYAFYILPVLGFFFLANALLNFLRDKFLIPVLVLLLATVGTILFGKLIYYPNIIEPSTFTADYIVGEAAIHARRNGGGKELAVVSEGEKVTVNGVSRDRKEFNITAKDGSTGWIPAAAFPEDANFPPDDASDIVLSNLPIIGKNRQRIFSRNGVGGANHRGGRDRDWLNQMETVAAYFTPEKEGGTGLIFPNTKDAEKYNDVWPRFGDIYGLSANMMNRAVQVNQPFPVTINADHGSKRDKYKVFSGVVEMTLRYVLYTPEATIIAFDPGDHEFYDGFRLTYSEERDYFTSLVLKDLDTGETFPFVEDIELGGVSHEFIFIFPPVATRHFALIHERPCTDKKGVDTDVWDIPEVRIAANAPTMANDPLMLAQRRAENFKSDGSNAMTMNNLRLYPERIPFFYPEDSEDFTAVYPEPLTVIPAGEVVTVLESERFDANGSATMYANVRYKDFEGWVNNDSGRFLKQ